MAIRIGIYGYGNLGRGVERAIAQNEDMELVGVFTRREPKTVKTVLGAKVMSIADIDNYESKIDVLVLCGGSATDLPTQTPMLARKFNVVDSFDTHAQIPTHFDAVDKEAKANSKTAMIAVGWDPGLFSMYRLLGETVLPEGKTYTFWGRGVSQGHSDAIRRIDGVQDARQYTVPIEKALKLASSGKNVELSIREKHLRECYVVAKDGADKYKIEREIKAMPNYFADYDTTVTFISQDEMNEKHSALPHGGKVIRSGKTGENSQSSQVMESTLALESNPEFTASVIVAYARAVVKLNAEKDYGCKTVFDVPLGYLSPLSAQELRKKLL